MTNKTPPAIELRDVHKSFGTQVVLDGIDLTLDEHETVVVLGRSGTGKSVLLKLIVGLEQPDSGSICIHGQEITKVSRNELNDIRKKIGFLFQEGALYDSLSLEDNVAFPLVHHDGGKSHDIRERSHQLLASVGMEKEARKLPSEISGGMKRRVGLARALALEPDILLFDEPTAGLDPITANEIEELLITLRKDRQISSLIVTHDVRGARAVADRAVFIDKGRVVASGTFEELEHADDPMVAQFLQRGE